VGSTSAIARGHLIKHPGDCSAPISTARPRCACSAFSRSDPLAVIAGAHQRDPGTVLQAVRRKRQEPVVRIRRGCAHAYSRRAKIRLERAWEEDSTVPTYYERSVRQAPEVWRSLRRRRASPPAAANSPDRGATFRSALEQAEQQFRAASFVDYDSRALNVFYGLSQAGRAVAAASRALHGNDWILQGHGLKAVNLAKASSDITVISVEPFRPNQGPRGSFTRLSQVLNFPLPSSVGLGELWPLMSRPARRRCGTRTTTAGRRPGRPPRRADRGATPPSPPSARHPAARLARA